MEIEVEIGDFPVDAILQALDAGAHQGLETGSDWIADVARQLAPKRTTNLARTTQSLPPTGKFMDDDLEARVASGAPYGVYVEFGTGVYGPSGQPWWVQPVDRPQLAWETPNGFAYSMGHWISGMEPQPFLIPAMEFMAQSVAQEIGTQIERALLMIEG